MTPKVKEPPRPKLPQSPLDANAVPAIDDTASSYKSLISTSPGGLKRKAEVSKKTLLGGVK